MDVLIYPREEQTNIIVRPLWGKKYQSEYWTCRKEIVWSQVDRRSIVGQSSTDRRLATGWSSVGYWLIVGWLSVEGGVRVNLLASNSDSMLQFALFSAAVMLIRERAKAWWGRHLKALICRGLENLMGQAFEGPYSPNLYITEIQ